MRERDGLSKRTNMSKLPEAETSAANTHYPKMAFTTVLR